MRLGNSFQLGSTYSDSNVLCIFVPSLGGKHGDAVVSDIAVICRGNSSVQRIRRVFIDLSGVYSQPTYDDHTPISDALAMIAQTLSCTTAFSRSEAPFGKRSAETTLHVSAVGAPLLSTTARVTNWPT